MARSTWKGPFCELVGLWNKSLRNKETTEKLINKSRHPKGAPSRSDARQKIWSRRSVILPKFIGKNFFIYNGKSFIPLTVTEDMVGQKFGEFANTRRKALHKSKIQTKKRK